MTTDDIESSRAAHRDMFAALKARRDLLEEAVRKKTEELKAICIKEGVSLGYIIVEMFPFHASFRKIFFKIVFI